MANIRKVMEIHYLEVINFRDNITREKSLYDLDPKRTN